MQMLTLYFSVGSKNIQQSGIPPTLRPIKPLQLKETKLLLIKLLENIYIFKYKKKN